MSVATKLASLQQAIEAALIRCNRPAGSVKLLAVSKQQPLALMQQVYHAGQRAFGENYLQEALEKVAQFEQPNIEWHFIGQIQANKTKAIAENFAWVHGVDRIKIARRLDEHSSVRNAPLNVCIEINVANEKDKGGIPCEISALTELAETIKECANLRLRGLMTIPKPTDKFNEQLTAYQRVAELQSKLIEQGFELDTLSMGMSNDFEAAIAAGSTIVRIGTALFGNR